MPIPIYLDFGKGWVRLGSGTIVGNDSLQIKDLKLPAVPKRAAICAMNDVLTVDIQTTN
jgi:hypothetical protein